MELKQLTGRIFYSPFDSAVDRPILGYVLGEDFSVMIDAGNSAAHAADYNRAVAEKRLKKPRYCVITHWHWDHTFGMHALEADTIACAATNRELRRLAAWEWNDAAMKQRLASGEEIAFADEHIRVEYDRLEQIRVVPAALDFETRLTLHCGGVTCECIRLPSPHSDDSVGIYIPEEQVIFLGDIHNDDFYRGHFRDLDKTRQLWETLNAIDFAFAVIGHRDPLKKSEMLDLLTNFLTTV